MAGYDYDAVVLGGGAAGLTAAGLAANFGAKTMMVEANRLGGDCTWTGCVPSKVLLKAGKAAHHMRTAGRYGLADTPPQLNTARVMQHLHTIRQEIYEEADRPEIYEQMGIEVVQGRAQFRDPHSILISLENGSSRQVTARYFFICTGGKPVLPPVEGLGDVPYVTSETFFETERLPEELVIIGGGNIGTEMAQALNRLGVAVTVLETSGRILSHDDPELADILFGVLKAEGVGYMLNAGVKRVSYQNNRFEIKVEADGEEKTITSEALLAAAGRRPNLEGLGLDAAGVAYTQHGVETDNRCRTNKKHIYACGDVTGEYQFTHMSDHMARVAVTNALLKFPMKVDRNHVPWCTFTDPELAHVGATEKDLKERNIRYEVYRFPYSKLDRAITDSERDGLVKVFAKKWNGKILGAGVAGARAGEIISEYAVAMKHGITLRNIADTIHPYPAYGLAARRAADQWYIRNQSEWSVKMIKKIFGYRGEIPDFSDPDRIV